MQGVDSNWEKQITERKNAVKSINVLCRSKSFLDLFKNPLVGDHFQRIRMTSDEIIDFGRDASSLLTINNDTDANQERSFFN